MLTKYSPILVKLLFLSYHIATLRTNFMLVAPFEILVGLIGIILGIIISIVSKNKPSFNAESLQHEVQQLLLLKKKEAEEYVNKVHERLAEFKKMYDNDFERLKISIEKIEKTIKNKEAQQALYYEKNLQLVKFIQTEQARVAETQQTIKKMENAYITALIEVVQVSREEVKQELIQKELKLVEENKQNMITKSEEAIKEEAVREAKNILVSAINRCNTITSVERKSNTIKIPKESVKKELFCHNGENIKLIEELLDVDIIFNDIPDMIIISAFDLVKRNIATFAMDKLLKEKIINTEKVKEKIAQAEKETYKIIEESGKRACQIMKMKNVHPDLIKIIGRLKFRTSYGQNILLHSLEVAFMSAILASEVGADIEVAKIAGFLHDVGKAIDHEVNEPHDKLTKDIMTKFGFSPEMIHAAWSHHEAEPLRTPEAHIVKAADALSAGRPGARQESFDKYLERILKLEAVSSSFEGVKKSFAISAGREVRVIVDPETVVDEKLPELAEKIASKIQNEMTYPGKIKVNVIRTTRVIEYAK